MPKPKPLAAARDRELVGPIVGHRRIVDAFDPDDDSGTRAWALTRDRPARPSRSGPANPAVGDWVRGQVIDEDRVRPLRVVAEADSTRACLYRLLAEAGPSPIHRPETLAEAERWATDPGIDDPELDDLRHLPFVTIDERHSRDLDQAVHVEAHDDGFRLYYAIADAAHFVRPGSSLFDEALDRGATAYLPGLVVPMLPALLSEDLVSLEPDSDRRALVFDIDLDARGRTRRCDLRRARVRSRLQTSYQDVQAHYDGGPLRASNGSDARQLEEFDAIVRNLEALAALGRERLALAAERDVVQVRRRELTVRLEETERLEETGRVEEKAVANRGFVALTDPRYPIERFNEQISLLCNIEGARLLAGARGSDAQPVFRFHQPPDDYRLRRLERQIRALARRHRLPADPWVWQRGRQSLADYLASLPSSGEHGESVDDPHLAGVARALHRQVLLAGGRSGFDSVPGIHHGVGAEVYARFTAPMREVVGIFVHKEAWELLGVEKAGDPAADEALRDRVVAAANRAKAMQRKLDGAVNRWALDDLFAADLRHDRSHRGVVLGISRSKVHVQLDDPPIDVKLYHRHLARQLGHAVELGRDGITLRYRGSGRIACIVGETVEVRALGRDEETDRWRLHMERLGGRAEHQSGRDDDRHEKREGKGRREEGGARRRRGRRPARAKS